jgi:hypothetical protein
MGPKTRGNYRTGICLRECAARGKVCDECIRFSEYKEIKNEPMQTENRATDARAGNPEA